ncbi:septum formation initiator family protein [Mycolicibacterium arenosum]|uniref:Septum formation initiator family protein n=1 Tax=Mycolicibacterium arenosum TaxID=2952157 RepID=A0ABT1LYE1_9MYCO|nr:septum formation initiator family protein [Mycolicibacterium sp. CAU 1645]MCP9271930.1 septum formation initiator family protein [Mycolicibacterium sp. CAU 1645]
MPDAKRPDPRRRTPASRPGKGGGVRGRPGGAAPIRREIRAAPARPVQEPVDEDLVEETDDEAADAGVIDTIRSAIADAAEQQSEQRFGSAARRAAILAAVVCVLTLTIAGPVRTYFSQRAEMRQLAEAEAQLRAQIADLEQQRVKLADPVYIASQARERLGFVMPGEIPYQVQLPNRVGADASPDGAVPAGPPPGQPWYTSLWHTISDAPHGVSSPTPAPPLPAPPPPAPGG